MDAGNSNPPVPASTLLKALANAATADGKKRYYYTAGETERLMLLRCIIISIADLYKPKGGTTRASRHKHLEALQYFYSPIFIHHCSYLDLQPKKFREAIMNFYPDLDTAIKTAETQGTFDLNKVVMLYFDRRKGIATFIMPDLTRHTLRFTPVPEAEDQDNKPKTYSPRTPKKLRARAIKTAE